MFLQPLLLLGTHYFSIAITLTGSHYLHLTNEKNGRSERLSDFPKVTQRSSRYKKGAQGSQITMARTEICPSNQVLLTTHKGFS